MKNQKGLVAIGIIFILTSLSLWQFTIGFDDSQEPIPSKIPTFYNVGSTVFSDDYLYLRNKDDLGVKEYILAETQFTNKWINRNYKTLREVENDLAIAVNTEILSCIDVQTEITAYWESDGYITWASNGRYYRQAVAYNDCDCYSVGPKQLLIDINQFLQNSDYSGLGVFEVLDDHILAFSIDLVGSELFDLYIYNYASGSTVFGPIVSTYYSARWHFGDLYYNVVSSKWGVPLEIYRFNLQSFSIEKVYEELDPALTTELVETNDREYLFIKSAGQITSEYQMIQQNSSGITLKTIFPRNSGVYYDLEHNSGYFYCKSNKDNGNFSISSFPVNDFTKQVDIYNDKKLFIERMEMLQSYVVLWVRKDYLRSLEIINLNTKLLDSLVFGSGPYTINPGLYTDIDSRIYRNFQLNCILYSNSSFLQTERLLSLNLDNKKVKVIMDSHASLDYSLYVEQQLVVADTPIPLSIVYKKGTKNNYEGRPLFINAYGAYGGFQDPTFSTEIFPLLNRGYVWAICHPRGDGDGGRNWYANGKFENKKNTFLDVQQCIDYLVSIKITSPDCVSLKGRSAGGLVAGNAFISNYFTTQFETVVANVPFIDPIYDMLDASVPWTSYEWTEWGSPTNPSILNAMLEYSPYHNMKEQSFPALYVSCGIEDSRVPFFEPLKFVAKVRNNKKDSRKPIIIKIEKEGHFMNERGIIEYLSFVIANSKCLG
ncbi:hypothetical protein HK103_002806 [Boothiomyces macroporosus]|uniref:Prolyl endopeptidase n=1 Tax=Boothiomyces macroporosus TaxID=261099 RepID=A0AAD5Y4C8_9FUNG|nr:hypothetical protein HK103_004085 [Boothiomyces macroporosus]KAJ3259159.1 hypothetical protein HK103_002806 [Boothiomyces macroporosus]